MSRSPLGLAREPCSTSGVEWVQVRRCFSRPAVGWSGSITARKPPRRRLADGTQLGVADGSVDFVSSLHLIEHFTHPELHVAELARVVADDGTCFVVTPNEPADFENPFHLTLFRPESLERLLRVYFDDVTIEGLDGSAAVKAEFDKRRRFARAVLRIDFMGLRHKLPRRHYVALHALARRLAYPVIHWRQRRDPAPPATAADFHISADIDDTTFVLFATAREPRRGAAARLGQPTVAATCGGRPSVVRPGLTLSLVDVGR